MDDLTKEHLAPYMPYGLQCYNMGNNDDDGLPIIQEIIGLHQDGVLVSFEYEDEHFDYCDTFPLMMPLSAFTDINSPAMNALNTDLSIQMEICDLANKQINYMSLSYGTALECFNSKIDIFDLISHRLAIDMITLK